MKGRGKLHLALYAFGLAGAALFTFLLIREGASQVGTAFTTAGWAVAAIVAWHLLPIFFDAIAWWVLFPPAERLPLAKLTWMRWIGESVSSLVPSAAVGGDIVRTRLAAIRGAPLATSAATVLVDLTLGVFTQLGFTLLGLWLLVRATGTTNIVGPALLGVVTGLIGIVGFYVVQRVGMFRIIGMIVAKLAKSAEWSRLIDSGRNLDLTIRAIYARRTGVIACCLWTIASLLIASVEIWLALYALGLPASLLHAVILQSTIATIRAAMFPVPGAIGVQEGGYVLVGGLLGIPGEAAFALSLLARVREVVIGVPGLIALQLIEGRRLLHQRSAADAG